MSCLQTVESGVGFIVNTELLPVIKKVLDAMPGAVVVADERLSILCANPQANELIGRQPGEAQEQHASQLFAPESRQTFESMVGSLFSGETEQDTREMKVLRAQGASFPGEVDVDTLSLNGNELALISIRDVSGHRRIQNELRTSQMLLAEAQRVAQLGSWRWDISDNVVHWSNELFRLFGGEPSNEPIAYEEYLSYVHRADRERVHSTISDAVKKRAPFDMEHRIVRPDGVVRLIYSQGAPGLDESGELVSLIGTAQDVTERKANEAQAFQLALEQAARHEAERTKERFQFLAEVSEALSTSLEYQATLNKLMRLIIPAQADWCTINTIDDQGQIERVAVAHRDPDKQWILESIRDRDYLPHGDPTHPLTAALQEARPQLHTHVTDEMRQRMARSPEHLELSRKLGPTSAMLVPLIARGRAFGIVTFGMSDSGRHYTDEDLQLAIEVAHRAAVSIDNAYLYHEAQEAARAREEFVSLVSHELKTPLTVIKGYIQVMERYLEKPDWERDRIRTTRERLSTQVERLELLVSDILDVSRMQRGRLDLNVVPDTDLVELARQVMERFDDAIERRPDHVLRIRADGPVYGSWDPLRLDQVFSNLLSNALKYSPDGGPIDVYIQEDPSQAIVKVRDSGVGISAEEQDSLFQPFQRGAAAARGISGTGLGLYITKQIIEQHGGWIGVDSAPGQPTTFEFTLPLKPELSDQQADNRGIIT